MTDRSSSPPEPATGSEYTVDPNQHDAHRDHSNEPTLPNPPVEIDTKVAHPRRIRDFLLGGGSNFAVDREVAEDIGSALQGGTETAKATFRTLRDFADRALRYLAAEAGIRQYLCVGTAVPTHDKLTEAVQGMAPESRIVYVIDNDIVMAHAHRLKSRPEGATAYVREKDLRVERMLEEAGWTLDLTRPVAVNIHGVLPRLGDGEARELVGKLMQGVVSGSYLVLFHIASDLYVEETKAMWERMRRAMDASKLPEMRPRDHAQVCDLFEGLDLVGSGVVPVERWHPPTASDPRPAGIPTAFYGGVARKP